MNARFRHDRKGVAAIEFAFLGPVLFILILGVVDLGRYFWIGSEVDHAIEAVLRDAAVKKNMSESDITSLLKARLSTVSKQNFSSQPFVLQESTKKMMILQCVLRKRKILRQARKPSH